jgi:hypothetical protein
MITVPQIKNTILSALAIGFLAFSASIVQGLRHHEAHSMADWAEILWDSSTYFGIGAFGWICTKSPLAKAVSGMLDQESVKTTELPSGAIVTEKTKTSVQVEAEPTKADK